MINLILKLIGEKRITNYLISQSTIEEPDNVCNVFADMFERFPQIKTFLKNQEYILLKKQATNQGGDFVKGQLLENLYIQSFSKKVAEVEIKHGEVTPQELPELSNLLRVCQQPNQGKKS